jgi:hypothetical protein
METFDLLSITQEGTPAHATALQVTELAKQARDLGLNDQADMMMKSFYSSISNRSLSGFEAAKSLAKGVGENVNAIKKQSNETYDVASGIDAALGYASESNYKIDPDLIIRARAMTTNMDVSGLKQMAKMIDADLTRQADSRQRLQEADAKGKMDPQAQIEANKMMATKLLRQFHNAQKILNDPEAQKAFTAIPAQQFANKNLGIGNNVRSYMDSIGGFNLGVGMQEVKETTGTAAGMAASETEAFKAAQSALKIDQDWGNAAEQLNIFNASIIRTLKGLGVRNEFLNFEGADRWLKGTDAKIPLLENEKIGQPQASTGVMPNPQQLQIPQGLPNPQMTQQPGSPPVIFGAGQPSTGTAVLQGQPQAPQQGQAPPAQSAPAAPAAPSTTQAAPPANPYATIRGNMAKQFNVTY